MSVAGESGNRAQQMREKVQQLTEVAERTTDPQERQKFQEQAKQQGQNAGESRSKGTAGGGRNQ
ncbi:DUF6381 family protein [Streptomyces sp. PSKA30]|uniref:DUF6381 family protein n=1 Tax=Streptomyces sp. PSKA30 TaxID=2874597 RepID=UPI001CD0A17B|nr:DUF6381 family protein [Streptomyces sp. PSKA30]MBZ9645175.1 DUF6381 family protein [Streptomyces sp. PSKA30]